MRAIGLTTLKAGMTRLRDKGGASPDSLYELTNGYIDASGAPTSRPGTMLVHSLPAGTVGLCAFKGKHHVFAMSNIDPGTPDVVVNILKHPDPSFAGTLKEIHFAKPFLGYLYVVAEFSNGDVFHFWMQSLGVWKAGTVYKNGDAVAPSVPNGYFYKATTTTAPPAWAAGVQRKVGDVVQPTVYNGWQYTVVEADGENPASGSTEPAWLTTEGALVYEDVDATPTAPAPGGGGSPAGDRYDNLPGYKQRQLQQDSAL